MFNSFPQPKPDAAGGSPNLQDWSAYTPVYDLTGTAVAVPASTWQTFVNVTGRGFLKWCRMNSEVAAAVANPAIKITVDGVEYTFDSSLNGSYKQGNEVNFEIPFKKSLKIEGFNRSGSAANLICDYLYLLQQSTPNANNVTLLQQTQRKMATFYGNTTTLADVVNITGSGYLLGVRFLGVYVTGGAAIMGDIIIDGVQKMNNRYLYGIVGDPVKLTEIEGPIRFNSSLRIRTRTDIVAGNPLCFAWYSLD